MFEFLFIFILTAPVWMSVFSPVIAGLYAIFVLKDLKLGIFLIVLWIILAIWAFHKAGAI